MTVPRAADTAVAEHMLGMHSHKQAEDLKEAMSGAG